MLKIILVMNAAEINTRSIDFAAYIAGLTQSKLTGLFIERVVHEPATSLKTPFALPYVETITAADEGRLYNSKAISDNIKFFENACIKRDICYTTELMQGRELDVITTKSRFADLVIISSDTSFETGAKEAVPTRFARNLLNQCECPVIVAPESFDEINEIIFACDGSKSAIHAIKQFTYLFPQLATIKITLLNVTPVGSDEFKDESIMAWLKLHYTEVVKEKLTGEPSDELFGALLLKRNKFIVMGSFGRTLFSLALKPSTAALLLKTVNLPIFIAHT